MQDKHKYHFDDNPEQFNQNMTIRLDEINKKIKDLEQDADHFEDLRDAEDFLNAFDSEQLEDAMPLAEDFADTQMPLEYAPEDDADMRLPEMQNSSGAAQNTAHTQMTYQPKEDVSYRHKPEDPFWNKKTIGLAAIVGMVAFLVCFGMVQKMFRTAPAHTADTQCPMIVTSVLEENELLVYDIRQSKHKTILLTKESKIYGKDNQEMDAGSIKSGDLLMATLDRAEKNAVTLSYQGIEQKEVSGLQANVKAHKLMGEEESYSYSANTLFRYQDELIAPKDLESCDQLRLSLIQDTVWVVDVVAFHGYLTLEHTENIKNGKLILDDGEPMALEDVSTLPLSEGTHTITISGENIESRTDSFIIEGGEELQYDLAKAQTKMGVLVIEANVEDYKLYINGELKESDRPVVLPLGSYDIVILKNGYLQWEKNVTLNADTITIHAELEEEITYGILQVDSSPSGAHVMVDGVEKGITPLQAQIPTGTHEIDIFLDGFSTYRQQIVVTKDADSIITAVLE